MERFEIGNCNEGPASEGASRTLHSENQQVGLSPDNCIAKTMLLFDAATVAHQIARIVGEGPAIPLASNRESVISQV